METVWPNSKTFRKARASKGWTQEMLSEKVELAESSRTRNPLKTIQNIEGGRVKVKVKTLEKFAKILGVTYLELLAAPVLETPSIRWQADRMPPGALLRAELGAVPFHGREAELADLEDWCDSTSALGLRLYAGEGGMGKTRLLIELCQRMRANEQWVSGFIPHESLTDQFAAEWNDILKERMCILAVLDYAETRRDQLIPLLKMALDSGRSKAVRIVLLARRGDDWWDQLKSDRDVGDLLRSSATARVMIEPLTQSAEGRKASYEEAAKVFAEMLGKPTPSADVDLSAAYFDRVLLLQMMALASVDGVQVNGENGILDYLLARETRFWEQQIQQRDLPHSLYPGIGQAMAAVTLAGGIDSQGGGLELLRKIPFFAGHPESVVASVNRLLHDCYPGGRWIEPVLPDLLGERLFEVALEDEDVKAAIFSLFG